MTTTAEVSLYSPSRTDELLHHMVFFHFWTRLFELQRLELLECNNVNP